MALTIGELTGFISLSDRGFSSGIQAAGRDLGRLQTTTTSTTADIEQTIEAAFRAIADDIANGVDPNRALAELDRLTGGVRTAMGEMESAARSGASGAASAIEAELGSVDVDSDLRSAGRSAGRAMVDGLESGMSGAREAGRKAGEDAAQGVEAGGRSGMGSVGGSLIGALKAAPWAAAGAAIAGILADAIEKGLEREQILTNLSIQVGAFGEESERLGRIAGEAYAKGYGESLEEVSQALARIVQNIDGARDASDDALGAMTQQALTVSKAMDEDVGRTIAAVSSMLRNDLSPSAEDAFNVLLRGQQEGVNRGEDLADTFAEYSTHFRDLGLSAEDALGLLNQGLKAGAWNSDQVADGLKELDIRVKDLSAKDALKELGLDAEKMAQAFSKGGPKAREALDTILDRLHKVEDPARRSQLAVELFGTKSEDMAQALSALDLDSAAKSIGNFENAVKQANDTLETATSTRVEQWKRNWDNAISWVGEQLGQMAVNFLPDPSELTEGWDALSSWFTDTVGPFFSDLWNDVSSKTSEIWDGIVSWLQEKGQAIVDWLKDVPTKVGQFFSDGWKKIQTEAGNAWDTIKQTISQKFQTAIDWLKEAPGKIGQFLSDGWARLRESAGQAWENIKKTITDKVQAAIDWLKEFPGKVKSALSDAASWLVQVGRDMIQGLINGVKEMAGRVAQAAKDVVSGAIKAAKEALRISSPSQVARDEIGAPIMQGVAEGILLMEPEVTQITSSAILKSVQTAKKTAAKGESKPAGHLLVEHIMKGVEEKEAALISAVKKVATKAAKTATQEVATITAKLTMKTLPEEPVLRSDLVVGRAGWTDTPATSAGVTVNIASAVVREDADLARIGSQVGYQVMARG